MLTLMLIFAGAAGLVLIITLASRSSQRRTSGCDGDHYSPMFYGGDAGNYTDSSGCSDGSSGADCGGGADGGGGGGGD